MSESLGVIILAPGEESDFGLFTPWGGKKVTRYFAILLVNGNRSHSAKRQLC